jgi:phasin
MAVAKKSVAATEAAAAPVAAAADLMKPIADIQEKVRVSAEKGIEQLRSHYATLKGNADAATDKLEASVAAAQAGTREINIKVLELFHAQTNAGFAHLQALFGAKTVSDAVKLHQDFAKTQVEALQANSANLAELAKKVATDVVEPVKDSIILPFKA